VIGFFIKKAFFDGWDNLIGLVLFNLGYIALVLLSLICLSFGTANLALSLALFLPILLLNSFYSGAVNNCCHSYSAFKRDSWANFKEGFARNARHALLHFMVTLVQLVVALFVIPFYMSMGTFLGLAVSVLMFWLEVFLLLALCYYWPLTAYLPGDRPLKTLRKCFLIFGDNMGFSLFFALYRIMMLAITVLTCGFIPGFAGMALANQDAIRLLMKKYDYLEENPEANRKDIPWDELLWDDRESVGPRSLKNMIFPWK